MRYEKISPLLRAFIGNREGFRRLGFPAEALFIQIARSAILPGLPLACFVVLRTQAKEFSVLCGPIPGGIDGANALEREYEQLCAHQHEIPEEDAERIWRESEIHSRSVEFILMLRKKGFAIPGRN